MKGSKFSIIAMMLAAAMLTACGSGEDNSGSVAETEEVTVSESAAAETEPTASETQAVRTKLTDIVGDRYDWLENRYACVSCADITRSQRIELISDIIYCDEITSLVMADNMSDFCTDDLILETVYENEIEYHAVYEKVATDLDEMYNVARKCVTESWASDEELKDIMFSGDNPHFKMIDGWLANLIVNPIQKKSQYLDYENAGIISYSDTSAVVWIADEDRFEYGGSIREYQMVRDTVDEMWKLDSIGFASGIEYEEN